MTQHIWTKKIERVEVEIKILRESWRRQRTYLYAVVVEQISKIMSKLAKLRLNRQYLERIGNIEIQTQLAEMLRRNSNALLWDDPNRTVNSFDYEIRIERREKKNSEGDCIDQWCWNLWDSKEEIGQEVAHKRKEEKTRESMRVNMWSRWRKYEIFCLRKERKMNKKLIKKKWHSFCTIPNIASYCSKC